MSGAQVKGLTTAVGPRRDEHRAGRGRLWCGSMAATRGRRGRNQVNERKLLDLVRNNPRNVRFSDLLVLVEAFGYRFNRITGSHRIYEHPKTPTGLNLQPDKHGKAKEYQVDQFLRAVVTYGLRMENEP